MISLNQVSIILAQSNIIVKYCLCYFTNNNIMVIDFAHVLDYNRVNNSQYTIEKHDAC